MRKVSLLFIGLTIITTSFAQMGGKAGMANEDLSQIKELKSSVLYIYIEKPGVIGQIDVSKKSNEAKVETRDFYKEVITEYWNFCEYKILNKDEYKKLSKEKDFYFLTNTLKGMVTTATPGASGTRGGKAGTGLFMLSKGKSKMNNVIKNTSVFTIPATNIFTKNLNGKLKDVDVVKLSKEKIKSDILLINNYLNDCIKYNTASMREIGVNNAPSIKGKKVLFHRRFVNFEQEELKGFEYFEPLVMKNAEIKDSYSELNANKDLLVFRPLFLPVCVITNEEYNICYYYKPGKAIKPRATIEDIQELDEDIGK